MLLVTPVVIHSITSPLKTHNARPSGFTLIELMIALAISALLLMAAIPQFSRWQARYEALWVSQTLAQGLSHAREQAITRNLPISFCGTNAAGECQLKKIIALVTFVDSNRNQQLDPNEITLGKASLNITGQISLNEHTVLVLKPDGTTNTPASFTYCPPNSDTPLVRRISLNFAGRSVIREVTSQANSPCR